MVRLLSTLPRGGMTTIKKDGFEYDKLDKDRASIRKSLSNRLIYSLGKDPITATHRDWFHTTAYAVRDRLIERWMETMRSYYVQMPSASTIFRWNS